MTADELSERAFGTATFAPFDLHSRAHREAAAALRDRLIAVGFGPDRAAALFGVTELAEVRARRSAYYTSFVLPNDAAGCAARFFVLHEPESDANLRRLLGPALVGFLHEMAAITKEGDGWRSVVSVSWFAGCLVLADARAYNLVWRVDPPPDYVMPPGGDSVGLLRVAPRRRCATALDLCCGAGAQTLAAAAYSESVVGVDLNPRALRFARVNAAANRLENVSFVQGDCYDRLDDRRFDVILANPPFVPRPSPDPLLYRGGGPLGDEVVRRILSGATERLRPGGSLAIVADIVDVQTLPERIRRWQGDDRRTLILLQRPYELIAYAETHAAHLASSEEREAETMRLMRHFAQRGIATLDFGYILQDGEPGSTHVFRTSAAAGGDVHHDVSAWFLHQQRLARGGIDALRLRLAPGTALVREAVTASDGSRAALRQLLAGPGSIHETTSLSEEAYALLGRITDGGLSFRDLTDVRERDLLRELLEVGVVRLG